jgi:DNA-binding CsgD family transcriptional regulator
MVVLACCPSHNALDVEDCFIDRFKQVYGEKCLNTLRGTEPLPIAIRNAIGEAVSRANRGRKHSETARKNMSLAANLQPHSLCSRGISTEEIVQLYEAGHSFPEIARYLEISQGVIHNKLKEAGVSIRPHGWKLRGRQLPENWRRNISKAQVGKKRRKPSEETKRKMREARLAYWKEWKAA